MNDPDIILADEPTASLDFELSKIFIESIHLLKEQGKSIIIATHDDIFENFCMYDKLLKLDKLIR